MEIFNNAFDEKLFLKIKETILTPEFTWHYSSTAYPEDIEGNKLFNFSFSHTVFCEENIKSGIYPLMYAAFIDFMKKNNQKFSNLLRIRVGLLGVTETPFYHAPHVDYQSEHKTALIYLNNSDGPTTFYKEFYDPNSKKDSKDFIDNLTISERIHPEENKMVVFNGLRYHASCTPTKHPRRITANFNFI